MKNKIRHISYSYLHILACPYAAFLRYEAAIKSPTTPWLALGNAVHYALEMAHKEGTFQLNKAVIFFNQEFTRILEDDEVFISWPQTRKMETEGAEMLGRYYEQLNEGLFPKEPLELEKAFSIPFGGTDIVGRIDKIDFVPATSGYIITDFKTGKAKPDPWFLRHNLQLTAYAWAAQTLYGKLPDAVVWHHLRTGELLSTKRTQQDVDDLKRLIQNAIDMNNNGVRHRIYHENVCGMCEYSGMPKAGIRPTKVICDDRELEQRTLERLGRVSSTT